MDASWARQNEQYLVAGLAWLQQVLKQLAGVETEEEPAALTSAVLAVDEESEFIPALPLLAQQFELSAFEQQLLLLCVGLELDIQIASLCAKAQDNPQRPYPTFALALTMLEQPNWSVVMADGALRYWQLIEVNEQPTTPLTVSALRADMRVVNYLKGVNRLDQRLMELVRPVHHPMLAELPPSQQATVEEMISILARAEQQPGPYPVVQLLGAADGNSQELLAQATAEQLGLQLYRLPVAQLPTQVSELTRLARLWHRETLLLPVALYLDGRRWRRRGSGDGAEAFCCALSGDLFFECAG